VKETYNFLEPTNRNHPIVIMYSQLGSELTIGNFYLAKRASDQRFLRTALTVILYYQFSSEWTVRSLYLAKGASGQRFLQVIFTQNFDTGWRRLIGSPNLQIIFHKRAIEYRSLLRKMTYKDKGSYESSPPCSNRVLVHQ